MQSGRRRVSDGIGRKNEKTRPQPGFLCRPVQAPNRKAERLPQPQTAILSPTPRVTLPGPRPLVFSFSLRQEQLTPGQSEHLSHGDSRWFPGPARKEGQGLRGTRGLLKQVLLEDLLPTHWATTPA